MSKTKSSESYAQLTLSQEHLGREGECFVDYLEEDYQTFGKVDKRHESLMRSAAWQIYGGIQVFCQSPGLTSLMLVSSFLKAEPKR